MKILFFSVIIFSGIFTLNANASEAICQSAADCEQECEQYEQTLNNDDGVEYTYNCSITGFTEVQTIEEDGTTNGHTEYNCLCVVTGMKEQGDGSDGGADGKPKPPVILNPLIPDFPGGELPPDNGYADCLKKANDTEVDMRHRCADEFVQDWDPDANEEARRLGSGGSLIRCMDNAEKTGAELRIECHKKWSKKSIEQIKSSIQSH